MTDKQLHTKQKVWKYNKLVNISKYDKICIGLSKNRDKKEAWNKGAAVET